MLAKLLVEVFRYPLGNVVYSVVIVAVLREVALYLEVGDKTSIILDCLDLGVLDCAEAVCKHAEPAYTECHKSLYVGVVQ